MAGWKVIPAMMRDERSHMFLLCFFLCSEEPVTTVALVSTLMGAPSTSGSPANLFSKTSYVSMKEEGTGLYTITIQSTSQQSVSHSMSRMFPISSQRCSHHCPLSSQTSIPPLH